MGDYLPGLPPRNVQLADRFLHHAKRADGRFHRRRSAQAGRIKPGYQQFKNEALIRRRRMHRLAQQVTAKRFKSFRVVPMQRHHHVEIGEMWIETHGQLLVMLF